MILKISTDLVDHPFVCKLRMLLGDPLAEALLVRALAFIAKNYPAGDLPPAARHDLEFECRWLADGELVDALVEAGVLTEKPEGGWACARSNDLWELP